MRLQLQIIRVVEELLKAGANVNGRSFGGVTPLHDAVFLWIVPGEGETTNETFRM